MIAVFAFVFGVVLFLVGRICVRLGINVYRYRKSMPQWRIVFVDWRDRDKTRVLDLRAHTADDAVSRFFKKFPDAVPTMVYRLASDAKAAREPTAPLAGATFGPDSKAAICVNIAQPGSLRGE